MKKFIVLVLFLIGVASPFSQAHAQTIFNCTDVGAGSTCPDSTPSLRQNTTTTGLTYVSTSGYYALGDGGGGDFYKLGVQPTVCYSHTFTGAKGTVGKTTISSISLAMGNNLTVGEAVSGSGTGIQVPTGAEIASIDPLGTSFTLTLPLTGTATGLTPISVAVAGDNGGTLILDSEGSIGSRGCYQKTNYRGEPHEWGAYGDGTSDDTLALENWLGAYGNVNPKLAPPTAPKNFGPWIATIPANYMVRAPLYCPDNTPIEAVATQTTGPAPQVRIFAARKAATAFTPAVAPAAVINTGNHCRLTGISIDGSGLQMNGTTNGTTTISNLLDPSLIQVGDIVTAADIPGPPTNPFTTVVSVGANSVTLTTAASGMHSELISFNGPNAVSIQGSRATIDGHSLIENGYNNVDCTSDAAAGTQLKDSQFAGSGADNLALGGCPNTRVIGNIITGSGGRGVVFGGSDITVSNGVIEQSAGIGLDLTGAEKVSVSGNFFDDNGRGVNGGAAIEINNNTTASICNNHLTGNGEYSAAPAQIHFGGVNDGINLCGNVYGTENQNGDATLKPSYAYDADNGTILTNTHLYESPPPQVVGAIYSPNAQSIVAPLQVPHVSHALFSGLTLANSAFATNPTCGVTSTSCVTIAAGEAADSTQTTIIENPGCTVDLSTGNGEGHLDKGNVAASTTYFFFAIAQAAGGAPNCIASKSLAPDFSNISDLYNLVTTASAAPGDNYIYNVGSVAGVKPGNALKASTIISAGTTVDHVGTVTVNTMGSTPGCPSCVLDEIMISNSTDYNKLRVGMAISDGPSDYSPSCTNIAQSQIPKGDTIKTLLGSNTVQLTTAADNAVSNDCITISGGNVVFLNGHNAAATGTITNQKISTAIYRLVGALYTNGSSGLVQFYQDGDSFYLANSVADIPAASGGCTGTIGTTAQSCQLSVPCGRNASCLSDISVEAFGRVASTSTNTIQILLSSLDQSDQTPSQMSATPGNTGNSSALNTAFPFRVHTSTASPGGAVRVRSVGGSTTVNEVTDGWVFHPRQ